MSPAKPSVFLALPPLPCCDHDNMQLAPLSWRDFLMRHIYHDRVERQQARLLNHIFILAVIEMHCHRDRGLACGLGGGMD